MTQPLARVEYGRIFTNFRRRIEDLRDDVLIEGAQILRREEEASIRRLWYDSGATLSSLQENIITEGDKVTYQLFPTATRKGFPYPTAGEYGTGRRGAATGRPAPRGWRYGNSQGMEARRYSRIAVFNARPQVVAKAKQLIANFTVN